MTPKPHSFHIPVMGIGYTLDTPAKVAHLGIDSVISLVDDGLMEKMRANYCRLGGTEYTPIPVKSHDYRARRITAYLNLMQTVVDGKFNAMKREKIEPGTEIYRYLNLLPDYSDLKGLYKSWLSETGVEREKLENEIREKLSKGSIDVNIMSKGDTVRYKSKHEPLPAEFNDAHAAVRGFMKSDLENASLIISAGLNPRLFTFIGTFPEVLPDKDGQFNKKIVIKVSDYRSALVQGKFLAQRGVWTSEFRIESGLNCGGHAFATKGMLLGPILEEFKEKRAELKEELRALYVKALTDRGHAAVDPGEILISAQGGIGTKNEADFLRTYYRLSSTGWGSPFLLVPEVVNIDPKTIDLLIKADENAIYLSNTSPFGIPFYSVKGNTKDEEKNARIRNNAPGSICPKRFVALNTEFGEPAYCTASKDYQTLKIEAIKKSGLDPAIQEKEISNVTAKTCICVGLGTAALLVNNLDHRVEGDTVSVCPGPNLAYFSKEVGLNEMVDHIYGRTNLITNPNRPHVFLKELSLYIDHLKNEIEEAIKPFQEKQKMYLEQFRDNLLSGIDYYQRLLTKMKNESIASRQKIADQLLIFKANLLSGPQFNFVPVTSAVLK
ncbi:MAG: hypothetical protein HYZ14_17635 [Bacteroidetes bacterium]|nr:hypothetical protein [Bacteroidota bacterium]